MATTATTPDDAQNLSVTGRRWQLTLADSSQGIALAQRLGVPEIVGRIMAARGVPLDEGQRFLTPNLNQLPDPSVFLDMDVATARLHKALEKGEKIAVFGDYDVDGSCAAAMLIRYFKALGGEVVLYIPDRLSEGYGPNPDAMQKIKQQGATVLITVDCGSLAFAAMEAAHALGMDVIITDHHQTSVEKPKCIAFINPNRVDENNPYTNLSGAGVAFILLISLNRALRTSGFFSHNRPEPDLKQLLDLVAVSTVCDVVPLTGLNRVLVDRGLKVMGQRQNLGLRELADISGVDSTPQAWHAGFMVGPRINAGGRISACDLGARLLSTDSPDEARRLAAHLHQLNRERQEIEQQVLEAALQTLEQEGTPDGAVVVAGEGWHPGVVGIVAARLKEKVHRPVFVVSVDGNSCKGSGRSVSGIDLGRAVMACKDVLTSGGGHAMAAGISLEKTNLEAFRKKLNDHVLAQAQKAAFDVFTPRVKVDGFLQPKGANFSLMEKIDQLAPYGAGNAEPRFAFSGIQLQGARIVGTDHVKITVTDGQGGRLEAISFRAMQSPLGAWMMNTKGRSVSVCGRLSRNVWNGRETIQLQIDDGFDGTWQGE